MPHSARRHLGRARASTSPCSRPMPPRSSSACSTRRASASSSGSSCRNTPTRSGTATCPTRGPGRSTATASTAPTSPSAGHRFNPEQAAARPLRQGAQSASSNGIRRCSATRSAPRATTCRFDERDSAPFMPKCRVVDPAFTWGRDRAPRCRGTGRSSTRPTCAGSPCAIRPCPSTCAAPSPASAATEVVDYIKRLGVTAVELLPIHAFVDDSHLLEKGLRNYWGYNTIGFFAPEPRYFARPGSRSPSSRRWWRTSTTPASR